MRWIFDPLEPWKYGAIIADPPWNFTTYSEWGQDKSAQGHYACMDMDDIRALPVQDLTTPGCLLWMWATWPMLPQALDLMEHWGFRYVTGGAWLKRTKNWKPGFGTGYWLRSATEPYLLGVMGKASPGHRGQRNVIIAPELATEPGLLIDGLRREHSRKPPEARQVVEALTTDRWPRLELFAREPAPGWDAWGNEVGKFEGEQQ